MMSSFAWKTALGAEHPAGVFRQVATSGLRETKAFEVVSASHRARGMSARHI